MNLKTGHLEVKESEMERTQMVKVKESQLTSLREHWADLLGNLSYFFGLGSAWFIKASVKNFQSIPLKLIFAKANISLSFLK